MSTPTPTTGFVLAGGRSRRMGRDKALIHWHGRPLLDHMINLLASTCDPVKVAGRGDLPDDEAGLGPLGGFATALRVSTTEWNLLVAVDLPLLTVDFLKYFKEHCNQSSGSMVVCQIDASFPLCLGVRTQFLEELRRYISTGGRSFQGLITQSNPEILKNLIPELFININTETDYLAALKYYKP